MLIDRLPPVGMASGGPLHFEEGGLSNTTEINDIQRQLADRDNPPSETKKQSLLMRLATLQAQPAALRSRAG